MAVAEIIGAAVGVLLLVIVAYLLVGNVLVTSEIVANAQKDLSIQNEARLRTAITISNPAITNSGINFTVSNNGTESIYDFNHMDVYSYDGTSITFYRYDSYALGNPGNWSINRNLGSNGFENVVLHPNELDPGVSMHVMAAFSGANPRWVEFCTNNGVYASANI